MNLEPPLQIGIIEAASTIAAPTNRFIGAAGTTAAPTNLFIGAAGNTSRPYKSIYRGGLRTAPTNA